MQAGVAVSASYGALKINTNANVGYTDNQTSSNDVATQTAHDVVSQAASSVTDRTLTRQTTSVTEKYKENDTHTFANPSPNLNVVGVYQWINEIDRAQIFNYGKRELFDIVVPEPAAFLLDAATTAPVANSSTVPPKPDPFTLSPGDLSADATSANYFGTFAVKYGAVGIPAQSAPQITVTKAFVTSDPSSSGQGSADLTIPPGYAAVEAVVQATYNYKGSQADSGISVFVGTMTYGMTGQVETTSNPLTFPLTHADAASISVAIHTYNASDYAVNVDILCQLTSAATASWLETVFDTIYTAYQARLKEYNDAVAQQRFFKPTVGPLGSQNPDLNRVTERAEIKKSCIAMMSNVNLMDFAGIQQDTMPTPPAAQAFPRVNWFPTIPVPGDVMGQGSLIRFFEEAFEWENMMYLFYPYFWGRKSTWYENVLMSNDDPLFEQFLAAGAVRAVIPVRQGFEAVVHYYMIRGKPWSGNGLPSITDSTYLPIAQEIADSEGAPQAETAVGDPWEVTIPTQQVILTGAVLPTWEQPDPTQWVWQPAEEAAQ